MLMSKEMRKASSLGVRTLRRKVAPDCCSSGSTFIWLPDVSSRIPMVSGRFFSCVKFLMVCGTLSSVMAQSLLARLVMKPSLSRAEKKRLTRLTFSFNVGASTSELDRPGASLGGGGAPGEGASWARRTAVSRANENRATVRSEGRIFVLDDEQTTEEGGR